MTTYPYHSSGHFRPIWIDAVISSGLLLAGQIEGAAPQLLVPIKPNADTSVVIDWQSDPAGIYSVEYSVGLANDWKVVAAGLPSQGSTTLWTDRGTPDAAQFRFSSADASAQYRFYRVQQERLMDTSMPITVSVTSPAGGSTLSGQVQIQGAASASQGLASVKLYVDGYCVSRTGGPGFTLPLETRFFANGSHRLSIVAEDIGAIESTEEPNIFSDREASYGVQNVNVVFDNTLSDARLRYEHFRPELGQSQQIFGLWSTPSTWRVDVATQDGATVYRSFSGAGARVAIEWDGRDAANQVLTPQLIGYFFNDLGPAPNPPPGGGGGAGGAPPSPAMAAVAAGQDSYLIETPPLPPPWEKLYGKLPPTEVKISDQQKLNLLTAMNTDNLVWTQAAEGSGEALAGAAAQAFAMFAPYSLIGTITLAGQGHHPRLDLFGRYPTPPRILGGNVRMSSRSIFGPWGPLKRVRGIIDDSAEEFARMGYSVVYKRVDDQLIPNDLAQVLFDSPNIFNRANIGLYVGHSVAAMDAESGFIWRQSYVPVYNSVFDSMTFVGSSTMNFGSEQLKWMAFFTCNIFRSDLYRQDGVYEEQKNFFALPLNGYLHIMQAYATEMSVHPDMPFWWTIALRKSPLAEGRDYTVIGAWNFVCRQTQKGPANDPVNIARSAYWPECAGDFVFGYGPQTEPNRDPTDPTEQADLEETDESANNP